VGCGAPRSPRRIIVMGSYRGRQQMTPSTVKKISPMLAVASMEETLAFYQNVLGFTQL